ncbi:MAG: hypothetical protein DYG91_11500 [Chloroflexi bacterium CFX7]|nr:hypothetical protein [Chloroflexi bacterium CFX7]
MATARTATRRRKPVEITPDQYAAFIQQLELESIWLADASVRNDAGPAMPEEARIVFEPLESQFELIDGGFECYHEYGLQIHSEGTRIAEIMATLGVRFRSGESMTNELFEPFREVNLPVNTWPFFREFVHTTLGRFGWVPFTLPAFKVGTPHDGAQHGKREALRRRRAGAASPG